MHEDPEAWWEDPTTDWTTGEPGKIADILAAAFPDTTAIRELALRAGVREAVPSADGPARGAWVLMLSAAAARGRLPFLVAEALQDDRSREFRALLDSRLGSRRRIVEAYRSIRFGVVPEVWSAGARESVAEDDNEQAGDQVAERVGPVTSEEAVASLQSIRSPRDGLEDPRAFVQSVLDAMWRTAVIEVGGVPAGTGFLVGPDRVLTAAHVIDPKCWPPDPLPEVTARFDYIIDPGISREETGVPVPVADFVTASLPTPEEVSGAREWDAPADRLDFAVLRLARPVPCVEASGVQRPRGGYRLDDVEYDFAASPLLFIVQHPLGDTQRVTWVRAAAEVNARRTRIRYTGNTLEGSSGSAVVDPRGRLVALHHYSTVHRNQAVPVSAIAKHLTSVGLADLCAPSVDRSATVETAASTSVEVDPFEATLAAGRAIADRSPLRATLRRMATDGSAERLLTIRGSSGSGMSYSYRLLAHAAGRSTAYPPLRQVAPDGLAVVPIDLASYVTVGSGERAGRVVRDVLTELGLPHTDDVWAQTSREAAVLVRVLRTGLRGSRRQWWIFVDGLRELATVKHGGLDEVIYALAQAADDPAVPLRLVLVGPEAEAFAADYGLPAAEDIAVGLTREYVERWFTDRARAAGRVLDPVRLAATLDELFPPRGAVPAAAALGPRLPKRLQTLLGGPGGF